MPHHSRLGRSQIPEALCVEYKSLYKIYQSCFIYSDSNLRAKFSQSLKAPLKQNTTSKLDYQ